jgi:beta-galactosidase
MNQVTLSDGCIVGGDERIPFHAGEVHYWRLNPARWPDVLTRVREIGLSVVSTYVPWQYHELAPGRFDFTGETEPPRNLVGFLRLLQERGFWVFIRPGPYIYAEWVNAGVPDRVVKLPRLSEEYRSEARVWMQAVTETLTPFFATRGGRICLFQPDNEMDLFSHWFEDRCGLDGTSPGFFQQFLRQAYPDVAALNRAWGTQYREFDEAQAFAEAPDSHSPHDRARQKDYWRFQHWAVREALRWHVEEYRRLGVDLPMVANYYPGGDVQNWREVAKVVDAVGIDCYPRNEFGDDVQEHRRFLDTCRYQRALSPIPMIAELQSGVWHGSHEVVGLLSPSHYRLMMTSALLAGIQGFNWYMLVGRDNWYFSPINERGEWRPELAAVFKDLHRVIGACDLPRLRKLTDVCALVEPVHIAGDGSMMNNAVLSALYDGDVDFEVYDPEIGRIAKPIMFYTGADWLPRASQERLGEYMERGGTLVVFRDYPRRDEDMLPHDALGARPPDRVLSRLGKKVELALGRFSAVGEGAVWTWDQPPGEPIWGTQIAGRQQAVENADKWMTGCIGRRWMCGYRERRGDGALVVIGLPANGDLARTVVRWLGRPLYTRAELPGVKTGLFERDDAFYLFAVNFNAADVQCRVELDALSPRTVLRATDLWTGQAWSAHADGLVVSLPKRSGGAWRIERPM